MLPFVELRGALPIAIFVYDMNIAFAFTLCVVANMIPVPFILVFFKRVENWLRRYPYWSRVMDKVFARTRRRAGKSIRKYEVIGLMIFVGIPLPVTGAWTGSLIAYLFDLDIRRSFYAIFAGVLIAGLIILVVSVGLKYNL
ncbi:MAG: small multi-drug export protein [Thermoplasmata archaeon]|nr:MAG: small multi-drug export protein [Thermoplasmata archaeon]